jgi:hypothetical protein
VYPIHLWKKNNKNNALTQNKLEIQIIQKRKQEERRGEEETQ